MSPPRALSFAFLLTTAVLLALTLGTAPVVATDAADEHDSWGLHENTSMVVELQSDGDAEWRISTVVELQDDNDTQAFRDIAESFESGEGPQLGLEAFDVAVDQVNQGTDREMELTDVERTSSPDSEIRSGTGRLTLEFTWENFARTDGNQLFIDDVLVTASGDVWFQGLNEEQTLTIAAPPAFGVRDANVGAEDGELQWEGPQEFDETSLQANFIGPGGGDPNGNGTGSGTGSTDPDPGIAGWGVLRLGLIPLGALALLLALYAIRVSNPSIELPSVRAVDAADGQSGESDEPSGAEEPPTAEPGPTGGTGDGGGAVATVDETPAEERIDEELLSDEERVERLLSSNGGRMKQADIVKETDWSNAKVSQLLSSMEEEGQIDKLRIGRENLISFPEEDIADIDE